MVLYRHNSGYQRVEKNAIKVRAAIMVDCLSYYNLDLGYWEKVGGVMLDALKAAQVRFCGQRSDRFFLAT